jgi:serine/threonine-protein kinase RsbW
MKQTQGHVKATLETLVELEQYLLPLIDDQDEETQGMIRLVLQELATNIVLHAYLRQLGDIDVLFSRDGNQLHLQLRDYAQVKFTRTGPASLPDPNSLPQGGWGLFIIHQGVDQVDYEALQDGNRWTLHKTFTGGNK